MTLTLPLSSAPRTTAPLPLPLRPVRAPGGRSTRQPVALEGRRPSSARTDREERRRVTTLARFAELAARPDDDALRRRTVALVAEDHLDVAESLARRYASSTDDWHDLRQVGCVGLLKAAQRFDGEKGDDFVAFAAPTISGEIKRHLRDTGWLVRPPRRLQELRAAVAQLSSTLTQQLGRAPSTADLAARLDLPVSEVAEAVLAQRDSQAVSLEAPLPGVEDACLGEVLPATDGTLERAERWAELEHAMRGLGERDRLLLRLRFVDDLSQAEIGRELGVTQMQVSRLLTRVLGRLRSELDCVEEPPAASASSRADGRRRRA